MILGIVFSTYYIYLLSYSALYMFYSCSFDLPWNTPDKKHLLPSANMFYYEKILNYDLGENKFEMHWTLYTAFLLSWVVVFICLRKGIELTGKIAIFTVIAPYCLMGIFLFRLVYI